MIDEDTLVEMGHFCQEVLHHPLFDIITKQFELATCQQMLATKPEHSKSRESIYQTFQGAMTFLDFLHTQVSTRDKILKARDQAIQEMDADYDPEDEESDYS